MGGCVGALFSGDPDDVEGWPTVGRTARNRAATAEGPGGDLARRWRWQVERPEAIRTPSDDAVRQPPAARYDYAAPVTDGDRVYLIAGGQAILEAEADREREYFSRVIALDPATGEASWQTPFLDESEAFSPAPTAPSVDDGTVVMVQRRLQAFDRDGEREWVVEDVGDRNGRVVATDGEVYLPTTEGLESYATADGSLRWTALDRVVGGETVAVADGTVYVPTGTGIAALNRGDGTERWRAGLGTESRVVRVGRAVPPGSPVVSDDTAYVAASLQAAIQRDSGALVALDREDGSRRWRFRPETPEAPAAAEPVPGAGVFGLPALHDGTLYAYGATGDERVAGSPPEWEYPEREALYAVDADDGSQRWRAELPGPAPWIVAAGDTVYAVTTEAVVGVAAEDGTEVTRYDPAARAGWQQPPAVVDGLLLVPTTRGLVALGPQT